MPVQGLTPAPRDILSWPTGHMRRFMASCGVLSILVCTNARMHELILTAYAGDYLVHADAVQVSAQAVHCWDFEARRFLMTLYRWSCADIPSC